MKHLNREVAIAKLFTPSARQGLGNRYTDDSFAFYEAPKKSARIFLLHLEKNHDSILLLGATRPYA
ncbi:hypothetical protein [Okeania sp. KiyG1]|uniref:hypothetical protein n=1 Tax=Okeania sp. KiyG1 TaxID=2720165 RepID=UPI001920E4DF|nr:hypothetical protein [Okeania sp. KiyG1]